MNRAPARKLPRRELLRAVVSGAALAGIAAAALLTSRRRSAAAPCTGGGICGRCPVLARCGLPWASAARQTQKGKAR